MHVFTINNHHTDRWNLSFADGTHQELIKAPTRKSSPLETLWGEHSGVETDRRFNQYESNILSLPIFIEGTNEAELLQNYNNFVTEVILSGNDILIGSKFLNRSFTLRYQSTSSTQWWEHIVTFNLELIDDYPNTITRL